MNEKNVKMKEIKYSMLYCVCEITVPNRNYGPAKVRNLFTVPVPLRQKVPVLVSVPGSATLAERREKTGHTVPY